MKASRVLKAVCAAAIVVSCFSALAACTSSPEGETQESEISGLTGGVAATVNGTEILEDTVTTWIENYRATNSLTDQTTWGQWLADGGYTPESLREEIIDYYAEQALIRQAATENEISVESSEIDGFVNQTKGTYSTEEKWQEALTKSGISESTYRSSIEIALLQRKVKETVAVPDDPTNEEILAQAQTYAVTYNGAKRSSHILFESTNETTAQEVLDKINSGELDFAEAAQEYSTDTASAQEGGDIGWDKLSSATQPQEYTDALVSLEKGQISGLTTSTFGIHIIKCTDVFVAPEEITDVSQIPTEFVDSIKASLESTKKDEAFNSWYTAYEEAADIVVNAMPENVPYNVDVSQFTPAEGSAGDTSTVDEATEEDVLAEDTEGETSDVSSSDETTNGDTTTDDQSAATEE